LQEKAEKELVILKKTIAQKETEFSKIKSQYEKLKKEEDEWTKE
jgi:hypothetical protein